MRSDWLLVGGWGWDAFWLGIGRWTRQRTRVITENLQTLVGAFHRAENERIIQRMLAFDACRIFTKLTYAHDDDDDDDRERECECECECE